MPSLICQPRHAELDDFVAADPMALPPSAYLPAREPPAFGARLGATLTALAPGVLLDGYFVSRPDYPPPSAFLAA